MYCHKFVLFVCYWNLEHSFLSFLLYFVMLLSLYQALPYTVVRGCLQEKTRTGASFIPGWLFDFATIYMMTLPFHISLFEGTLHVDKIHVWFKVANITHALPVPVYRQTDLTPKRVATVSLYAKRPDFVPEWNSRPGTRTGVNSRRGDSRRHDILWWYHVNKYKAMRGNLCELTPGRKSPRCHVILA